MARQHPEDSPATLLLLVLIPLAVVFALSMITMGVLGGRQLLGFAFHQLFTLKGLAAGSATVVGITFVTLARHMVWFDDEPPPMWFRGSGWTNILEFLVLVGIVALGI